MNENEHNASTRAGEPLATDLPPDALEYRSLSLLAVVTVLLGAISILSFLAPVLWFLALPPILLGAMTLSVLANRPDKVGRKGVLIAMVIAMFFGLLGPAHFYSSQWWVVRNGRRFADQWLEMVQRNELDQAYQFHLARTKRIKSDMTFKRFFTDFPDLKPERQAFFAVEPIKTIIDHRDDLTLEFVRGDVAKSTDQYDMVCFIYMATFHDGQGQRTLPLDVKFIRALDPKTGHWEWTLGQVDEFEKAKDDV